MIKKVISWGLGIPALIIVCSEVSSLSLEWIRLLAILILIGVAFWNRTDAKKQIPNRRRKNEKDSYYRYIERRDCASSSYWK